MAQKLKTNKEDAQDLLSRFWNTFPKIKLCLDSAVQFGRNNRYALSPLDRRIRWLTDFNIDIPSIRYHTESICKNHPCQGTNASIIKLAMVYIQDGFFETPEWIGKLLATIHDELLTTNNSKYDDEVVQFIKKSMVTAGEKYIKSIPVVVEIKIGKHWIH